MSKTRSIAYLIILFLAACQNGSEKTDPCSIFHPVYWNDNDIISIDTQRQILVNNESGHDLCGW